MSERVDLRCIDLEVGYGGQSVQSELSISFQAGSTTAVVGPSGVGKSTLLFTLGLLLKPKSGSVFVAGVDTSAMNDGHRSLLRAAFIGFVFQNAHLDGARTVIDNILEPCLYAGVRASDFKGRALESMDRLGIEVPPNRRCNRLSGGEEQRIALCRAQILGPKIVLADEPTGNLDPDSSERVFGELGRIASAGSTVLIVTHSPQLAERCDSQVVLRSAR